MRTLTLPASRAREQCHDLEPNQTDRSDEEHRRSRVQMLLDGLVSLTHAAIDLRIPIQGWRYSRTFTARHLRTITRRLIGMLRYTATALLPLTRLSYTALPALSLIPL